MWTYTISKNSLACSRGPLMVMCHVIVIHDVVNSKGPSSLSIGSLKLGCRRKISCLPLDSGVTQVQCHCGQAEELSVTLETMDPKHAASHYLPKDPLARSGRYHDRTGLVQSLVAERCQASGVEHCENI